MEMQFRAALNCFNRSDVITFLQNMTEKHKAALLDAQAKASTAGEEATRLRVENEALRARLTELQSQPKQEAPVEPSLQQQELEAYRRAIAMEKEAAEKLAAAEAASAEALRSAEAAAAEKVATAEAAAAEKVAAAEAAAAEKLAAAEKEAAEKTEKARAALAQIQEKVAGLTAFLADTASSIEGL